MNNINKYLFSIILLSIFALKNKTFIMNKYITHTPTIKDIVIWFVVLALAVLIPYLSANYLEHKNIGLIIIPFLILGFFGFNMVIRKSLSFKNYFKSRFNPLTSKMRSEKVFDISPNLMFEKTIEVIDNSNFKLAAVDKNKFEILATTKISWLSWGENLYISFESIQEKTIMKLCSVTLFQITSWGKNEKNFNKLLQEIEHSFTI